MMTTMRKRETANTESVAGSVTGARTGMNMGSVTGTIKVGGIAVGVGSAAVGGARGSGAWAGGGARRERRRGAARAGYWTVSTATKGNIKTTDYGLYTWNPSNDPYWGEPHDPLALWGVYVGLHDKSRCGKRNLRYYPLHNSAVEPRRPQQSRCRSGAEDGNGVSDNPCKSILGRGDRLAISQLDERNESSLIGT